MPNQIITLPEHVTAENWESKVNEGRLKKADGKYCYEPMDANSWKIIFDGTGQLCDD